MGADGPFVGFVAIFSNKVVASCRPKEEEDGEACACDGLEKDVQGAVYQAYDGAKVEFEVRYRCPLR